MAWADIGALNVGDEIDPAHFDDIQNALIERCDWIGNSTEKTNAQNLPDIRTAWGAAGSAGWLTDARGICEAIVGSFEQGKGFFSGSSHSGWSDAVLKQYIFDNHGGEASGIGKSGSTYNWINRPTRIGALVLATTMPQNTYSSWLEQIKGLYWYINHLDWFALNLDTANHANYSKQGSYQASEPAAWTNMKAAAPAQGASGKQYIGILYQTDGGGGTPYRYRDTRVLVHWSYAPNPLVYPTAFQDAAMMLKLDNQAYQFKGPWKMLTGVTKSAAGVYTTGSSLDDSLLYASVNVWEEFVPDNPDNIPKSEPFYNVLHDKDYDAGSGPAAWQWGQHDFGTFIVRPTTIYGV